jgi:hypothetical protein
MPTNDFGQYLAGFFACGTAFATGGKTSLRVASLGAVVALTVVFGSFLDREAGLMKKGTGRPFFHQARERVIP